MNLIVNQRNYGLLKQRNFYNKIMRGWLDINYILTYSTPNKGKSVITERFINTLKAKIYKK